MVYQSFERRSAARAIALAMIATTLAWLIKVALITNNLDSDVARLIACSLVALVVLRCCEHSEKNRVSWLSALLLPAGLLIGGIIAYLKFHGSAVHIEVTGGNLSIAIHLLLVATVVPFFEELVVRRLLFGGAAFYLGSIVAALVVSGLFGLSHPGAFWIAFIASLALCVMTRLGVSTFDRTVAHGAYNLSFTVALLTMANPG